MAPTAISLHADPLQYSDAPIAVVPQSRTNVALLFGMSLVPSTSACGSSGFVNRGHQPDARLHAFCLGRYSATVWDYATFAGTNRSFRDAAVPVRARDAAISIAEMRELVAEPPRSTSNAASLPHLWVVAEFPTPHELIHAVEKTREAAIAGSKRTRLPGGRIGRSARPKAK